MCEGLDLTLLAVAPVVHPIEPRIMCKSWLNMLRGGRSLLPPRQSALVDDGDDLVVIRVDNCDAVASVEVLAALKRLRFRNHAVREA